jgi:glycyl-tRNA synthetase beta subunit
LGDFEANPNHLNIAFREQYDRHMFDLLSNKIQYMTQLTADRYLLELSSNLEPDITSYLNKITINIHDDRELTEQRKNILFKMRKLFSDFLDFDKFI